MRATVCLQIAKSTWSHPDQRASQACVSYLFPQNVKQPRAVQEEQCVICWIDHLLSVLPVAAVNVGLHAKRKDEIAVFVSPYTMAFQL